ncbi:MAG: hypothetical protein LBL52_04375 [Rickettsiales bacterium]|jgi:hypothetical protein|nr:hypothetical protein [Rickettsiales bacterium]
MKKTFDVAAIRSFAKASGNGRVLDVIDRHGIPVSMNSSMNAAGRFSFKEERTPDGKIVRKDMKVELNPDAHGSIASIAETAAHESQHVEDILEGSYGKGGFKEADRGELEVRAEDAQRRFARSIPAIVRNMAYGRAA